MVDWLRRKRFSTRDASIIWRGFLQSLPWMGAHLSWQVGDGKNVLLGIDPIIGLHSSFSLPEDLRTYLEDMNIYTLEQARNTLHHAQNYWLTAEELDLEGSL